MIEWVVFSCKIIFVQAQWWCIRIRQSSGASTTRMLYRDLPSPPRKGYIWNTAREPQRFLVWIGLIWWKKMKQIVPIASRRLKSLINPIKPIKILTGLDWTDVLMRFLLVYLSGIRSHGIKIPSLSQLFWTGIKGWGSIDDFIHARNIQYAFWDSNRINMLQIL